MKHHAMQGPVKYGKFRTSMPEEHMAILDHTVSRAAGGRYCGDSLAMQELVRAGLMHSLGKAAWCPDEYFTVTEAGRSALRKVREAKT